MSGVSPWSPHEVAEHLEAVGFVLVIVTAPVVGSACARAEIANGPVLQGKHFGQTCGGRSHASQIVITLTANAARTARA
jgi:hypothetical protein